MSVLDTLRNRLLRRLHGHAVRELAPRCQKPRIGVHVVHARKGLRLTVQAGMSDDLWLWLMKQGWRVDSFRPDRRVYNDIPASQVTRLIDSDPPHRKQLMLQAIHSAQPRAALIRKQN